MNHEEFERDMIDAVNRNADEKAALHESAFAKTDKTIMTRGLKRVGVALLTAASFVISFVGIIVTAFVPGYMAVLTFAASGVGLLITLVLLYAQGLNGESGGEGK